MAYLNHIFLVMTYEYLERRLYISENAKSCLTIFLKYSMFSLLEFKISKVPLISKCLLLDQQTRVYS